MKRSAFALLFILLAFALTLAGGPNAPRLLCRDTGVVFAEPLNAEGHCFCCFDEEPSQNLSAKNNGQIASKAKIAFSGEPCCAIVQQDTKTVAPVVVPPVETPCFAALAPAPFVSQTAFLAASVFCVAFEPASPRAPPQRCVPSRAPPCLV